jgi:hypothetical protein
MQGQRIIKVIKKKKKREMEALVKGLGTVDGGYLWRLVEERGEGGRCC